MTALASPRALAHAGLIEPGRVPELEAVAARYAVAVTAPIAELIACAPDGPVARQFLPDLRELESRPEELADPIGDAAHSPVKGIVHRYPDRLLLTPTHACAVYCRFCFRREVVGPGGAGLLTSGELDSAFAYIAADARVWEVIVTGGDPLTLSPRRLRDLSVRLAAIPHVKVVRFHTRLPVASPERVTAELVSALACPGKAVWVALHANHADELTPAARAACARIVDGGLPMVSQTVLLKGINDDAETLSTLMRAFVETRIKPYYLHHGDLAPGTSHLRATVEKGRAVMRGMRGALSGLAQPTYVLDIPGGHGKAPIGPTYLHGEEVEDWRGVRHRYPPPVPDTP